jgi:hypothetical protein
MERYITTKLQINLILFSLLCHCEAHAGEGEHWGAAAISLVAKRLCIGDEIASSLALRNDMVGGMLRSLQ